MAAAAFVAGSAGHSVPGMVIALAALWYDSEAALARAAGWHLSMRSPLVWMLRDALLIALWIQAWSGSTFVWHGNEMRLAGSSTVG